MLLNLNNLFFLSSFCFDLYIFLVIILLIIMVGLIDQLYELGYKEIYNSGLMHRITTCHFWDMVFIFESIGSTQSKFKYEIHIDTSIIGTRSGDLNNTISLFKWSDTSAKFELITTLNTKNIMKSYNQSSDNIIDCVDDSIIECVTLARHFD